MNSCTATPYAAMDDDTFILSGWEFLTRHTSGAGLKAKAKVEDRRHGSFERRENKM
jgi:hypothetical protein